MYYVPAVRQRSCLIEDTEAEQLTYWRGTYQVRIQLGRWLEPPKAPKVPKAPKAPRPPGMVPHSMLHESKRERLAAGILRTRAAELASTAKGGRNLLLWRAAVACRRLTLAGVLDWGRATADLEAAGAACGLPAREVALTIAKGEARGNTEGAWDDWG